jgi:triosephosphate isomerase
MKRTVVIAANWKMNKNLAEARRFAEEFRRELPGGFPSGRGIEAWVAPVACHLPVVAEAFAGSGVVVAAQNAYGAASGAFTGEISAAQARDAGAEGTILGHSERRSLFGETDRGVAARLAGALQAGLAAIVCIGEPLEVREAGRTLDLLREQLDGSLAGLEAPATVRIRVAYEPVWAIGTGRRAEIPQIDEAHGFIRSWLRDRFGYNPGSAVPILYGGSVKPETAPELLGREDVDGLLVGGASLEPRSFADLVRAGLGRAG